MLTTLHSLTLHKTVCKKTVSNRPCVVLVYLTHPYFYFIMATITLEIPDELMPQIIELGDRFPEWLMVNLPDSNLYPSVSSLSDDEVKDLARLKLSPSQNDRLGELQTKGKASDLAEIERYELLALLQIYQLGQMRKSEAIAESTKRGFPLAELITEQ
jgi:hypothetical protein